MWCLLTICRSSEELPLDRVLHLHGVDGLGEQPLEDVVEGLAGVDEVEQLGLGWKALENVVEGLAGVDEVEELGSGDPWS